MAVRPRITAHTHIHSRAREQVIRLHVGYALDFNADAFPILISEEIYNGPSPTRTVVFFKNTEALWEIGA
jgi:hypothetical protein